MAESLPRVSARVLLPKASFQRVFDNLEAAGFTLVGPTVRDSAIVLEEITRVEELPLGWSDEQSPGKYRLEKKRGSRSVKVRLSACAEAPPIILSRRSSAA